MFVLDFIFFSFYLFQTASAQAALQAAQAITGNGTSETQGGPNTVLRVIVEHLFYPVSLQVLHKVTYKALLVFDN